MLNRQDDMDEWMRQAANDYPLKTGGADWDKVLAGMQASAPPPPSNGNGKLWLLLLLLLLPVLLMLLHQPSYTPIKKPDANSTTGAPNIESRSKQTMENVSARVAKTSQSGDASTHEKQDHISTGLTAIGAPGIAAHHPGIAQKILPLPPFKANNHMADDESKKVVGSLVNNMIDTVIKGDRADTTNAPGALPIQKTELAGSNIAETNSGIALTDTGNTSIVENKTAFEVGGKAKQHADKGRTQIKGVYAGLAAGIDITTVRFRKIYTPGYNAAFLLGYRFSNHWSVESGLQWNTKNYYSPGKYFDKKNTGISPFSYIYYLEGTCRMLELPLNVKYDFGNSTQHRFFIMAGLSSYFMKQEDYEYHATNNGNYYVGHKTYNNATNNLFSVATISGGYYLALKQKSSVRIAPYIKLPLHGLGIGKLPFESTGISAAYTMQLR